MKAGLPWLALLALGPVHAQETDPGAAIRDGRTALEAGHPAQARSLFAQALAQSGDHPGNAFAAAVGLGRAAVWLGDYRTGASAFRQALALAANDTQRRVASTGLAQALNAQDYPRQAYALVAPYASGDPRATLELMRAAQSTGQQRSTLPALAATKAPAPVGYLGTQYALLADDMRYATANQVEADASFSHDSEGLDTWEFGASVLSAPRGGDHLQQRWGASVDTVRVDDGQRTRQLHQAAVLSQWRMGAYQSLDLRLGMGSSNGWQYAQGDAHWNLQPSDSFAVSAGAERTPLLTDTAIGRRIVYNTFSLGTSLRAGAHWYVLPTAYQQDFSDGNRRHGGVLRLVLSPMDVTGTSGALGAQASIRSFHGSQPGGGVYFNPRSYRATQVGLIGVYSLNPSWKLRATADTGRQTIDGTSASIYSADVSVEGRLPHNGRVQLHMLRSSVASVTNGGAGYWNNTLSLSVSYPF